MKKNILLAVILLCTILITACGAKEAANGEPKATANGESEGTKAETEKAVKEEAAKNTWKGEVPEEGWAALAERTEYYDLTVKQEEIFDLGLWEKMTMNHTLLQPWFRAVPSIFPLVPSFIRESRCRSGQK